MRPRNLVHLVLTNLARTRFRAAMSASGVLIGTAAIVILVSLAAGLQQVAARNLGGVGPLNEINVFTLGGGGPVVLVGAGLEDSPTLGRDYLDELAGRPGVQAVTPVEQFRGQATALYNQFQAGPNLMGVDPDAIRNFDLALSSGALDLGRWQVVAGAKLGENFTDPGIRAGDSRVEAIDLQDQTLTLKLTRTEADGTSVTRTVRLQVVGVLAERGFEYDYGLVMRLADVEELNTWASGKQVNRRLSGYTGARVLMRDAAKQTELEAELQEAGFLAFSGNQILRQINATFYALQAFVGFIGGIALIIAGTGIANTLITAIYERTAEIGLMKAVGATNAQVTQVFLAEAAAIGGLGGLAGLIAGLAASQLINLVGRQYILSQLGGPGLGPPGGAAGPPADIVATPFWLVVAAPLIAAAIGAVAGLYPARRAAALDPVVALRYE